MKRIHLLRVAGDASAFEPLINAVREDGGRVGWLDLELLDPVPPSLVGPSSLDFLRAVGIGSRLAIAVKPMRGEPVLRDLLREHFRGCRVVLVKGPVEAPLLRRERDSWTVTTSSASTKFSTEELVAALRKPRPFGM